MRSNKIMTLSPMDTRPAGIPEDSNTEQQMPLPRSHTPGHLSQESIHNKRKNASSASERQRSQSVSVAKASNPSAKAHPSTSNVDSPAIPSPTAEGQLPAVSNGQPSKKGEQRRPLALRSTSAIASKSAGSKSTSRPSLPPSKSNRGPFLSYPPMPTPQTSPNVSPAPASGMYWSLAPVSGHSHTSLRAHTTTLINSSIYVFGGCDSRSCFNELYIFDPDSMHWSSPATTGTPPIPLRAMTTTAVGKKMLIFGGGDGPAYYNDVYILDTLNCRWSKPEIPLPHPSKRRAHTACLYKNGIYVFGGGDGVKALNDVWRLDVSDTSKMSWKLISPATSSDEKSGRDLPDNKPKARGYHTANMVGSKLIIFGGSDGGECFKDIWIFDVETLVWHAITPPSPPPAKPSLVSNTSNSTTDTTSHTDSIDGSKPPSRSSLNRTSTQTATSTTSTEQSTLSTTAKGLNPARLSHTATLVGSYLFIIGGHDGISYSSDVLLLNLVTMTWDKRKIYGAPPPPRGYHGAVLYDSRLFVIGGFDGGKVFGEVYILELAVHAYFSQISHFSIEF